MLHSIIRKAWRDLAERKARTLLTLVGLSIGLWGVASVAVAWWVLSNDLSENFTATSPPAIVIGLEAQTIKGDTEFLVALESLKGVPGVVAIENRAVVRGRMQIYKDYWLPAVFWVIEDFNNINVAKVWPQSGEFPPEKGGILIERDSQVLADWQLHTRFAAGDDPHAQKNADDSGMVPDNLREEAEFGHTVVQISLAGGIKSSVSLNGTVHDPAQAPSRMEKVMFAYVTPQTVTQWEHAVITPQLLVVPSADHMDGEALRQLATKFEEQLIALGYTVDKVSFPSSTEHVHQFQMDSILFLLSAIGCLALIMSTVLVVNLINSILRAQVRQIGVLKAIGATRIRVLQIYLLGVGLVGVTSCLLALPLAIETGYVLAYAVADFLNFDILTTQLPNYFLAGICFAGLAVPLLAALVPIMRWTSLSVGDAFQYSASNPQARALRKLGLPFSMGFSMGIQNAFRDPVRLALTASTVAVGLATFMVALNIGESLVYTASQEEKQKRYDVFVSFEDAVPADKLHWMAKFKIVERVETWAIRSAKLLNLDGQHRPVKVVPEQSEVMAPYMLSGEWLNDSHTDGIVINQRLSYQHPAYRVGNSLALKINDQNVTLPIIGIVKEFDGAGIYMREAGFRKNFPGTGDTVNGAYITLKKQGEKGFGTLIKLLNQHFVLMDIGIEKIETAQVASRVIRAHLDVIVEALLALAAVMLCVSTFGMASGISTSVVERTRELGVLRAIGGKSSVIAFILTGEAITMALLGWLLAMLVSQPLSRVATDYFGTMLVEYPFNFMTSWQGILQSFLVTLVIAVVAVLGPMINVNQRQVSEALTYE